MDWQREELKDKDNKQTRYRKKERERERESEKEKEREIKKFKTLITSTWGIQRLHKPNSQAAKHKEGAVHPHDVEFNSEKSCSIFT